MIPTLITFSRWEATMAGGGGVMSRKILERDPMGAAKKKGATNCACGAELVVDPGNNQLTIYLHHGLRHPQTQLFSRQWIGLACHSSWRGTRRWLHNIGGATGDLDGTGSCGSQDGIGSS